MSLIDKLLQADAGKLTEKPTEKIEIPRLSKLLKCKFEVEVQALDAHRHAEIQRQGINLGKKGGIKDLNLYDMKVLTLLAGVKDPNLKDPALLSHFSASTPKDLIGKLFLPGEIDDLYSKINELSGYEDDADEIDEEVKN